MQKVSQAFSVIYTEMFLWLTHQKLDWPENFWCNFRNWGGKFSLCPPRLCACPEHSPLQKFQLATCYLKMGFGHEMQHNK